VVLVVAVVAARKLALSPAMGARGASPLVVEVEAGDQLP
jgi:hypothetical protein